LRRSEALVQVGGFDACEGTLTILGKGRGTQTEKVSLPKATVEAINSWLECRGELAQSDPLFVALSPAHYGRPLTGDGLYRIVGDIAKQAGIKKTFSPVRIRHSSITAALDATNGNVRKVQKLSRHRKADTLLIYDDNRTNAQKEISELLSDIL